MAFPNNPPCGGQRGAERRLGSRPIVDRTREHPSSSDAAIVQARMLLLRALRNQQEGLPPLAPNDGEWAAYNALPIDRVVAAGEDWRVVS